jgi:hypothetical protein
MERTRAATTSRQLPLLPSAAEPIRGPAFGLFAGVQSVGNTAASAIASS